MAKKKKTTKGRRKKVKDKAENRLPVPPTPTEPPPHILENLEVPLSESEGIFINEYLIDRNATRSYQTTFPGCTYFSAGRRGHEMRHRPQVDAQIRAAIQAQSLRTRITADRVLKEIARVAFSDIVDLYDPNTNQLYNGRNIPFETRRAVAAISVSRERRTTMAQGSTQTTVVDTIVKYAFWPKMEALGKLCKHLGLDTEISPLEALLQALPRDLSMQVRQALAREQTAVQPSKNGTHHPPETQERV